MPTLKLTWDAYNYFNQDETLIFYHYVDFGNHHVDVGN